MIEWRICFKNSSILTRRKVKLQSITSRGKLLISLTFIHFTTQSPTLGAHEHEFPPSISFVIKSAAAMSMSEDELMKLKKINFKKKVSGENFSHLSHQTKIQILMKSLHNFQARRNEFVKIVDSFACSHRATLLPLSTSFTQVR